MLRPGAARPAPLGYQGTPSLAYPFAANRGSPLLRVNYGPRYATPLFAAQSCSAPRPRVYSYTPARSVATRRGYA